MKVVIRTAAHPDIPRLVELSTALSMEDGTLYGEAIDHQWAQKHGAESFARSIDSPTSQILVAEIDAHIVGSLHGYVQAASWRSVDIAVIISIFVDQYHRSSGIGAKLIATFQDWATEQKASRLAVSAFVRNEAAVRFYEREGFRSFEVTLEKKLS